MHYIWITTPPHIVLVLLLCSLNIITASVCMNHNDKRQDADDYVLPAATALVAVSTIITTAPREPWAVLLELAQTHVHPNDHPLSLGSRDMLCRTIQLEDKIGVNVLLHHLLDVEPLV
jgi:hypothetical protein